MFIQVTDSENHLLYFDFESLVGLQERTHTIYLSSGVHFSLTEKSWQGVRDNMCAAGRISGLGRNAQSTSNYPNIRA